MVREGRCLSLPAVVRVVQEWYTLYNVHILPSAAMTGIILITAFMNLGGAGGVEGLQSNRSRELKIVTTVST
jgi:hypothetical protein